MGYSQHPSVVRGVALPESSWYPPNDNTPGQLLRRNVKRFRGGLVLKAHRLLYHSTLGLRAVKKKKKTPGVDRRSL